MAGPLRHLGELARAQGRSRTGSRWTASSTRPGRASASSSATPRAQLVDPVRVNLDRPLRHSVQRHQVDQGSANLIDDAVRERGVDVFLAGVAGRGFTERYWQRILPLLEPRAVVPTHYDNFFRPLGQDLEFVTAAEPARLPEEIAAVSGEIELSALPRADLLSSI